MHLDHLILAATPAGLANDLERLAEALGATALVGGEHPVWGTRNALIACAENAYLEIVEVADAEVASATAFGSAILTRSRAGGGLVGWAVAVDDLDHHAARLSRSTVAGRRVRPDGHALNWRTLGTDVLVNCPHLPFLITWDVPAALHPSTGTPGRESPRLSELRLAGEATQLSAWLDLAPGAAPRGPRISWTPAAPGTAEGSPGVLGATIIGRHGPVEITA